MVQGVTAFAAGPDECADPKRIAGQNAVGQAFMIVVVEFDQEFDLVAFALGDVFHGRVKQTPEIGIRIVLDARTE
jgi:hypothetical protein